jgi:hypothetical protein
MKTGGLFVAAFLLISGMFRLTGSSTPSPVPYQDTQNRTLNAKRALKTTYQEELAGTIQDFYGAPPENSDSSALTDLSNHWNVPQKERSRIQFAVAILPDPVHTHLGLFFDRSVESLMQAAQKKSYVFDRAVLPWDRWQKTEPSDPETRSAQIAEQTAREAYPGLLIFRPQLKPAVPAAHSLTEDANSKLADSVPLLVFVIGETPTGGLRKEQFRNARKIMREIGQTSADPATPTKRPMLILGPSFSGSLESLHLELAEAAKEFGETYVYTGTVTSAHAITWFDSVSPPAVHFASFQENDDYALAQFVRFASYRGYGRNKIAVLSEDETTYGAQRVLRKSADFEDASGSTEGADGSGESSEAVQLHFPREISYFRSAYQKESAAQQSSAPKSSGISTLPPDLGDPGNDDDSVPPYAGVQTPRSQEAVMLGIVSELQKHHIEFTVLLATDPVDELFLARYLRQAYPQGRVVVITPDLLFIREEDSILNGVLGLNNYSLIPGLNDRLCRQNEPFGVHEDRLFVSSSSVGTFNAMVGLLSVDQAIRGGWDPGARREPLVETSRFVPPAPYAEYGTPLVEDSSGEVGCQRKPLLWITILGRDGFWPIVGMSERALRSADHQEPIAQFRSDRRDPGTLKIASGPVTPPERKPATMPGAWSMAYCLSLLLLVGHAVLSWTGTILADSEFRAQFARNTDGRATIVLALGALALAVTFVVLMCTRTPIVAWTGGAPLTVLMWLPFPIFVGVTLWDIAKWRSQPSVAWAFAVILTFVSGFQLYLACYPSEYMRSYWSSRIVHITSGVSPILPVLLLLAAGYWWMWMGLRGISLVDLRRPRLPEKNDLCNYSFRITDVEGETLRKTAHPFFFAWQVLLPVAILALLSLTLLDLGHPLQTIEGWGYDWGFSLLLALMIATFLGCLLKLVISWLKCRQILSGLDRTPLRLAFSRMTYLSWHSFWNPGGSSLRETYKLMSRALENLDRLKRALEGAKEGLLSSESRAAVLEQIQKTEKVRNEAHDAYMDIVPVQSETTKAKEEFPQIPMGGTAPAARSIGAKLLNHCERKKQEASSLEKMTDKFAALQISMAKTAAVIFCNTLMQWWPQEQLPVVSTDARLEKQELSLTRVLAEEFTALIYVNFLVTVLLRLRTLVICAGGMYVFIVLSVSVYPFEPHPALQSLTVILLLVMGVAVGFVYAEMHRDAILSRLTSTPVGELGVDFWLKLAAAGAIPVFSLLAAQFPQISQFLFSWLEPALQAVK